MIAFLFHLTFWCRRQRMCGQGGKKYHVYPLSFPLESVSSLPAFDKINKTLVIEEPAPDRREITTVGSHSGANPRADFRNGGTVVGSQSSRAFEE